MRCLRRTASSAPWGHRDQRGRVLGLLQGYRVLALTTLTTQAIQKRRDCVELQACAPCAHRYSKYEEAIARALKDLSAARRGAQVCGSCRRAARAQVLTYLLPAAGGAQPRGAHGGGCRARPPGGCSHAGVCALSGAHKGELLPALGMSGRGAALQHGQAADMQLLLPALLPSCMRWRRTPTLSSTSSSCCGVRGGSSRQAPAVRLHACCAC